MFSKWPCLKMRRGREGVIGDGVKKKPTLGGLDRDDVARSTFISRGGAWGDTMTKHKAGRHTIPVAS